MPIEFFSSARSSLGVEMELELIDRQSRELVKGAHEILAELGQGYEDGHPKAKPELLQSTVECITGICQTVAEAREDLTATIVEVRAAAARRGLRMMCSGTHPFTDWNTQEITPNDRYHRLIEQMQWPARQMQIFGIHVHVGVRSPEKAIAMLNALCAYIPHLLALSASSPYWMGRDTGLASSRSKVFETLPTAGIPYHLSGWPAFENFMETLISAQTISSVREVWWDIRPHPGFGTIELRVCDGIPTLDDVATMAAIAQSLVERFNSLLDRGYSLPAPRAWVTRENKWRAARYGLDCSIIVDEKGGLMPLRDACEEMVEELLPTARRLGCADELLGVHAILDRGPSYIRQRAIVARGGSLIDVVDDLCDSLDASVDRVGVTAPVAGG